MLKTISLLGFLILTGCSTSVIIKPMPAPPKCINIPGEGCKKISAGNVGGTTLGHQQDEDQDLPAKAGKF